MITFNLNGQWELHNANGETLCPVTVPGTVISALMENNKIAHPYYRENEYSTRELFRQDYAFAREFWVDDALLQSETITLVCEGLDTLTQIYINHKLLATTNNMHRTYRFAVKEYLNKGVNHIRIVFRSVLEYISEYKYAENKTVHYIPSGAMYGNHLVRKGHSMFGWDWGPQLVDAGIWRDIYLIGNRGAEITDVRIRQTHNTNHTVSVNVAVTVSEPLENPSLLSILLEDEDGVHITCQNINTASAKLSNTNMIYETTFLVENPKLWWPNGYGSQPLYTITVSLSGVQTIQKTIGLRTLTISQEKDEWGNEFAFMINGLKIFTRGGNYIPEDAVYPWIKTEQIDYLLRSCVRASFNCIRVWGGGYYPSDTFYDLCDKYGLIVWQDLMYACNVYDVTDDFAETVRQETLDNVRRIRHHASLGLWCGNNEIESAWDHWGDFQIESPYLRADYIKLFEHILPKALREADDTTFYWPSSPSSGGCFDSPDSENRGDNHYWDVWHGQKPFSDYQKYYFRFCSEFGFQSFPCLKTVNTFAEESDQNIFSKVMESHQKNDAANGKMLYYLSENFKYPKDFKNLLYISQILQGIAIKSGVDHWRRNRGRCMGTLYWQINDNWPVASWASIDYYGRWKALHYMAVKFYAPISISIQRVDKHLHLYLENETKDAHACQASLRIRDMEFNIIQEWKNNATTSAFASSSLLSIELAENLMQNPTLFVEAEVQLPDGRILIDTETLLPYKHLELPVPQFTVDVTESNTEFVISVQSNCFAPFVELDFDDADVIFSDNYFSITKEQPVIIKLDKSDIMQGSFENAADLKKQLQINTVAQTYETA